MAAHLEVRPRLRMQARHAPGVGLPEVWNRRVRVKKLKIKAKRRQVKKARRGQRPKKDCTEIVGRKKRVRWRIK